ncbi:MAG TPA: hypothetical protein VJ841_02960 [Candidatus Saccharimonadales bacterium]|nr:hypothetical protein [Candidatus Saccharimonadales bacterium]
MLILIQVNRGGKRDNSTISAKAAAETRHSSVHLRQGWRLSHMEKVREDVLPRRRGRGLTHPCCPMAAY